MAAAEWFVDFLTAYSGVGLAFAAIFVVWGVGRVDPVARASSAGFRVIIIPGVVGLWPLLLYRWARAGANGGES